MLSIIGEKSDQIRALLSPAMIPSLDAYILEQENIERGKERVEEMISFAKGYDKFTNSDFAKFCSNAASNEEIARVIVVMLGESVRFCDRPRVGEDVGAKRLQVGALIGKAAAGGALAVSNLSIGALAALTVLPTLAGSVVATALAVVGSTFTGLATACDAVDKIAAVVRQ